MVWVGGTEWVWLLPIGQLVFVLLMLGNSAKWCWRKSVRETCCHGPSFEGWVQGTGMRGMVLLRELGVFRRLLWEIDWRRHAVD